MPGRSSCGCSPHPAPPDDDERQAGVREQRERLDERAEILARLERRHRQHVRPAEVGDGAVRGERRADARVGDEHPLTRERHRLREVVGGEGRVGEDDVARRAPRSRYLRPCIDCVRFVVHSGRCSGTRSWIVVARTPARCGGYIQSRVVERVERAEPPLGGRAPGGRPGGAPRVREREREERQLDVDAGERLGNHLAPGGRGRREGDDLVARARAASASPPSEPRM